MKKESNDTTPSAPKEGLTGFAALMNPNSVFKAGSLRYTRNSLLLVMFWMLWADFCLQLMENLPHIIPIQLESFGANNATIGIIRDSMMHALAFVFVPIIGMQSDRHRGPMGRRRPFLLWSSFPVFLFLVLLGFAIPIANWVFSVAGGHFPGLSANVVGITMITLFTAGFFFFNNYVLQVYQYLFADVIPKEVMGSFVGLYRAVGALGGFVFHRWIFGHSVHEGAAEPYSGIPYIFIGCGLVYFISFIGLVINVKEGEYPPVEEIKRKGAQADVPMTRVQRIIQTARTYFVECYSHSFYLKIFALAFFFWAAYVPFQTFILFFATEAKAEGFRDTLHLTKEAFGAVRGWTFVPQIIVFLICGYFVDKFHPLRIILLGICGTMITFFVGYLWIHTETQLLVWWIANQMMIAVTMLGYLAMFPRLFPQKKYGQFFSANQIFFSVGVIIAPVVCGSLLDTFKDYRLVFLWSGVCAAACFLVSISLYRHWKRLGGDDGYEPPETSDADNVAEPA